MIVEGEFNASAVQEREDVARLNAGLRTALEGKGVQFLEADAAVFRAALKKAGFYADWTEKFGAEAWKALEDAVGGLA